MHSPAVATAASADRRKHVHFKQCTYVSKQSIDISRSCQPIKEIPLTKSLVVIDVGIHKHLWHEEFARPFTSAVYPAVKHGSRELGLRGRDRGPFIRAPYGL